MAGVDGSPVINLPAIGAPGNDRIPAVPRSGVLDASASARRVVGDGVVGRSERARGTVVDAVAEARRPVVGDGDIGRREIL